MTSKLTPQEIDEVLQKTLEDHRLSRGERRALTQLIEDGQVSEQERNVWRSRAFETARRELSDPRASGVLEWLEEVVKTLQPRPAERAADSQALFTPGDDAPSRITGLLRSARRRVDVCVFTITDNRIANALIDAHRRGVKLRIITDNDKTTDRGSDIVDLSDKGIPIRVDNTRFHMHHKFAIFDQATLLTGSYNWTRGAAEHNHECLLITDDAKAVGAFSREFEHLWDQFG